MPQPTARSTSRVRRGSHAIVLALVTGVLLAGQACGSSTPTTPSTPNTPVTPPPATTYSISGQVVETLTRAPIGGARVESGGVNATTDGQGRFTLTSTSVPPAAIALTVSAGGHRTRETGLAYPRTSEAVIDLISTSGAFNEGFFNQIARNGFQGGSDLQPLFRWSSAPQVYLKTTDETGAALPPEVLSVVNTGVGDAVRLFSAGAFSAVVETGSGSRPEQTGWINVEVRRNLSLATGNNICGVASSVGGNPSIVQLRLETCGCGSTKVPRNVVLHEVGHALGFFHVSDESSVMFPADFGDCRKNTISPLETTAIAVAYARPRGNRDPDRDPPGFLFFNPLSGSPGFGGPISAVRGWGGPVR